MTEALNDATVRELALLEKRTPNLVRFLNP